MSFVSSFSLTSSAEIFFAFALKNARCEASSSRFTAAAKTEQYNYVLTLCSHKLGFIALMLFSPLPRDRPFSMTDAVDSCDDTISSPTTSVRSG